MRYRHGVLSKLGAILPGRDLPSPHLSYSIPSSKHPHLTNIPTSPLTSPPPPFPIHIPLTPLSSLQLPHFSSPPYNSPNIHTPHLDSIDHSLPSPDFLPSCSLLPVLRPALLAAAENFTVLIKNNIRFPAFNYVRYGHVSSFTLW